MITLITEEDIKHIWTIIQKLDERTKIHTKHIQELQKQIKELKEKLK